MFAIFLFCIILTFVCWLAYQPQAQNSKLCPNPEMAISSNGKANIHSGEQVISNQAKSDRYFSNGKSAPVLLTVSIEQPEGQEPETIEFHGNGGTVLLANEDQSNDNSQDNSVLVKISIEMPKGQELKKQDIQGNQATILVANGHQSVPNGNGNNENEGSSNDHLVMQKFAPEVKVKATEEVQLPKQDDGNAHSAGTSTTIPLPNGSNIQLPDETESIATPPDVEKPQFDQTIIY